MKFLNKIMQKWFCCHEWEERKLIQEYLMINQLDLLEFIVFIYAKNVVK